MSDLPGFCALSAGCLWSGCGVIGIDRVLWWWCADAVARCAWWSAWCLGGAGLSQWVQRPGFVLNLLCFVVYAGSWGGNRSGVAGWVRSSRPCSAVVATVFCLMAPVSSERCCCLVAVEEGPGAGAGGCQVLRCRCRPLESVALLRCDRILVLGLVRL